jgi:glycosyltransferase involved in cell wall biosynthesis
MPKLLKVSTVPITLEAFFLPFAEHFKRKGWGVDAGSASFAPTSGCSKVFDQCFDFRFSRSPLRNNIPQITKHIRRTVAEGGHDIVHVHTPNAAFITRLALRNQSKPRVVYTAHGFHYNKDKPATIIYWWLEKWAAKWTDRLILVNEEDYKMAKAGLNLDSAKIKLIPSAIGIDLDYFRCATFPESTRREIRDSLNIPGDAFVFLKIAEFIPRKRVGDAIRAFAALNRPNAYLLLAGSGPELEPMQALAETLGLKDRIRFLGFRRDVPKLIIAADAVLLVSEREGLPRSIMEAMALERPVIGTDAKGTRELVRDVGLLVKVGDVPGIKDAMSAIVDKNELRKKNAALGLQKIQEYSLATVLAAHENLYSELLRE